jgi:hypothetical protein
MPKFSPREDFEAHVRQQIVDVEHVQAALDVHTQRISSDRDTRGQTAVAPNSPDHTIPSKQTAARPV